MNEYKFVFDGIEYYISDEHHYIKRLIDNKCPESQRKIAISFLTSVGVKTYGQSETTRTAIGKIIKYLKTYKAKIKKDDSNLSKNDEIMLLIENPNFQINAFELENAKEIALSDWWYGTNQEILEGLLKKYPKNLDNKDFGISKKVKYLDTFYSTNLNKLGGDYVQKVVDRILKISDFDFRLLSGDKTLVGELMSIVPGRSEFSFATKYCAFHNPESYYIFDSVNREILPKVFKEFSCREKNAGNHEKSQELLELSANISKFATEKNYIGYDNAIEILLGDLIGSVDCAKRKLDWLIWYRFRKAIQTK